MSHPNPFQPWKPHTPGLGLDLTSGNYVQNLFHLPNTTAAATVLTNSQNFLAGQNVANASDNGQVIKSPTGFHTKLQSLDKLMGLESVVNSELGTDERNTKLQQFAEKNISNEAKQKILHILEQISDLSSLERLLLYLRLPGGHPETDPLRQSQNPLGQRSEINHTINWVKSHLEHDENVSIPKQEVYDDYVAYCGRTNIKPLSTADFGKVMKQVFPNIRPRRLGTRGNSRYCYAAMRKATKLECPMLPELGDVKKETMSSNCYQQHDDSWFTVKSWAESLLTSSFSSLDNLAEHIQKQHLNSPASMNSRQLLQKKLLQRENKEKRKTNDPSKKKRKKRKKLLSQSLPTAVNDSSKSSDEDDEIALKTLNEEGSSSSSSAKNIITRGTNSSCDTRSAEINSSSTPTSKNTTALNSAGTKKLGRPVQDGTWAQPNSILNDKGKQQTNLTTQTNADEEQEKATKRLKPRLGHNILSNSGSSNNNNNSTSSNDINQQSLEKEPTIDLPISRERMESLCTIDKDELDDYLLPDNSQDQEAELLQIFQTQGKTASSSTNSMSQDTTSGVPLLENYQLFANGSKSQQLSELRNILAQNLHGQSALRASTLTNPLNGQAPNRSASSALVMLSQGRNVVQPPVVRVSQNPNTFVPIRTGGQTFVSPRSTPVQRCNKNKPSLAPLQTNCMQFKQEFPISAPTSPSLQQNYRYYPHANPNSQPPMYVEVNRSRSVPVPQFDQSYPDSAMSSMNPTPVPSEIADFGSSADSNLLDMLSDTNTLPTVKSELISDYYGNEPDDGYSMMPEMRPSIVSRSVPSTPVPGAYANGGGGSIGTNLKYHMNNNNNNNNNAYKSVPTTPVHGPSTLFRYSPLASRDCLINGYAIENKSENSQSAESFSGHFMQQNFTRQDRSDSMIEGDIFNEMS